MKANFLKACGCVALCSLFSFNMEAGRIEQHSFSKDLLSLNSPEVTKLPQKAAGMIDISWTVNLPEGAHLNAFYVYSVENQKFRGSNFVEAPMTASLEPGHYFFYFHAVNGESLDNYFYVSRELDILEETHFEFDLNECVNHIKLIPLLPDGAEALCPMWSEPLGGFTQDSNIESGTVDLAIFRKESNLTIGDATMTMQRVDLGDRMLEGGTQFYVNDLGENFDIVPLCYMKRKDTKEFSLALLSITGADLEKENILTNSLDNYVRFDANYGEIADIPQKLTDEELYRFTAFVMRGNKVADMAGIGLTSSDSPSYTWVCFNNQENSDIDLLFRYGKVPAGDYDSGSGQRMFYPINSFPATYENGKVRFNAYISDDLLIDSEIMRPEGGVAFFLDKPFTYNPRFSWEYDPESIPTFGNSVPLLVAATEWQPGFYGYSCLYPFYYGRLGEDREPDIYGSWAEVEIDGDNVFEGSLSELVFWSVDEFSLPKAKGNYTFLIENDCALVDGKESLNRAIIKCNASGSDREAPTLTMLNFRNQNDEITDRFASPEDCVLEFSAADLSSAINEFDCDWFKCQSPAEVKVEYAAENNDNFKELPVTEVPELFFAPAFGSFYRVPFSGADLTSATGWFKLRITVTDFAGNSQQQTLTPVVYIDSLTSVDEIEASSEIFREGDILHGNGEIRIFDLAGRLVRSGNEAISINGLNGAYIVRNGGKAMKIML